jgi:hypothetical protein
MGRFLTRDTWDGNDNQPLSFNRWNYSYSNPVNLTDPSGNYPTECLGADNYADCIRDWISENCPKWDPNDTDAQRIAYIKSFGLTLEPAKKWTGMWLTNLSKVLFTDIGATLIRPWLNRKSATLFIDDDGTAVCKKDQTSCYSGLTGPDKITFKHTGTAINSEINMLHEFGHLVDNLSDSTNYFTDKLKTQTFTLGGKYWGGTRNGTYNSIPSTGVNNVYLVALKTSPIGGDRAWQQGGGTPNWEDWADIFSNGIMNNIDPSTEPGGQMSRFFWYMEENGI